MSEHHAANITGDLVWECRSLFLQAAAMHRTIDLGRTLVTDVFNPARIETKDGTWSIDLTKANLLLVEWSKRHNLNYDWVRQLAREMLQSMAFVTSAGQAPERIPFFRLATAHALPRFEWAPLYGSEPLKIYEKRTLKFFRQALNEYLADVRDSRRKMLPRNDEFLNAHYRWAVEYTCLNWGWTTIAEKNRGDEPDAIRKAVTPILRRVGIPIRS